MAQSTSVAHDAVLDENAVCLFCGEPIDGPGLGFYAHVEASPACEFRWKDWMIEIPKDHGGA